MFTKIVLATLTLLTLTIRAQACDCAEPNPIESDFASYQNVLVGEVVSKTGVDLRNDGQHEITDYYYTVRVTKAYKGFSEEYYEIKSAASGSMCGYGMEVGETHLLWVDYRQDGEESGEFSDVPWITNCDRSKIISEAGEDLDWLERNAGAGRLMSSATAPKSRIQRQTHK